jgi:hypothetical protein
MKKSVSTLLLILSIAQPSFSGTTRTGKTESKVTVGENIEASKAVKDVNESLSRNGLSEFDLSKVNLSPKDLGVLTSDLKELNKAVESNPIFAKERLEPLMDYARQVMERVSSYDLSESEVPGAAIMGKAAKNIPNILRSALDSSTNTKPMSEILEAMSNATLSGNITTEGIRSIIEVAQKNGLKFEEVALCK